jgi:hypothetical protein
MNKERPIKLIPTEKRPIPNRGNWEKITFPLDRPVPNYSGSERLEKGTIRISDYPYITFTLQAKESRSYKDVGPTCTLHRKEDGSYSFFNIDNEKEIIFTPEQASQYRLTVDEPFFFGYNKEGKKRDSGNMVVGFVHYYRVDPTDEVEPQIPIVKQGSPAPIITQVPPSSSQAASPDLLMSDELFQPASSTIDIDLGDITAAAPLRSDANVYPNIPGMIVSEDYEAKKLSEWSSALIVAQGGEHFHMEHTKKHGYTFKQKGTNDNWESFISETDAEKIVFEEGAILEFKDKKIKVREIYSL